MLELQIAQTALLVVIAGIQVFNLFNTPKVVDTVINPSTKTNVPIKRIHILKNGVSHHWTTPNSADHLEALGSTEFDVKEIN